MGRRELIAMLSAIMAFTGIGIDVMLPAFDEIRLEFDLGATSTETSRLITVFFLGLAAGQLFFGPLADRFGRKATLYMGATVFVGGAIGAALAPTFGTLLVARFIWGIGSAGARVVATSVIRDRFEGAAMASAMSNIMAVFLLVPVVAPSIGAGIIAVLPWRSVFWFCALFAIAVVIWSMRLRETLDPANRRELDPRTIISGYMQVARTPVTFGYTAAAIFIQAAFVTYVASIELMVSNIFDRESLFPFVFGGVGALFGLAALINGSIVERLGIDTVVNRALAGISALIGALIILVAVSSGTPNFWLFMLIVGLVLSCFMFLMPNLGSAAMLPLGEIAGSGSALTGAVRIAIGAAIGGYFSEQIDTSVTPFVAAIAVLVACTAATVWLTRQGGVRGLLRS